MRIFILWCITALYLLASSLDVTITANQKYENFSIGYFKDRDSSLSFEQIQNQTFTKSTSNFALGYVRDGSVWFKVIIHNQSDEIDYIISLDEHFYENVELYYKNSSSKNYTIKTNSVLTPLKNREVKSSKLSFYIPLTPSDTTTIFIKAKGKYAYFGNIVLFPQSEYNYNHLLDASTLYIFIFGVLSIIVVFSLFLFIRLKEKIYGYYLGYSFFSLFYMVHISGLLAYIGLEQYLYKFHFSSVFMVAFLLLFSMDYLEIKRYLPKVNRVLSFIILPLFGLGIISTIWYEPWNQVISNTVTLLCILLLAIAIKIYLMGHKKSRYYILATVLYLGSGIIWVLLTKGSIEYTFFTRYIFFFMAPVETTMFTLMLADHYHEMKEKKIKIQKQLIKEKNNYQTNLENEVKQKTQNLTKLLAERELLLNEVNHRVKNNFHMLIGILWLDERKNIRHDHTELINRIKSLSSVHETLYTSDDLENISANDYLEKIINNIHNAYQNQLFSIDYDIVDCNLQFEQAVSLGVIINELLTNSIVHNSDIHSLKIKFTITQTEHQLQCIYKDSGKGFDKSISSKGLGLTIIDEFIQKLTDQPYTYETQDGINLQFFIPKESHAT